MDIKTLRITLALVLCSITLRLPAAHAAGDTVSFSSREPAALASILTVTKAADTNDGACDADCSLREAIVASASGDTIVFAADLAGQTITLGSQLDISKTLTIDGSGLDEAVQISGNNAVRAFNIAASGGVTLSTLSIVSGTAEFYGGGLYNATGSRLVVQNSLLSGNTGSHGGGGIYNLGALTVQNSLLSTNQAYGLLGLVIAYGGGIYNRGALTVTNSTLSGNLATAGGGICNRGALTVTNSTLSGNLASKDGGGLYTYGSAARAALTHVTLSRNVADHDNDSQGLGGGLSVSGGATLSFKNTIVAGNDERSAPGNADCSNVGATLISQGYNLVGSGTGCPSDGPGDLVTADPLLASLTLNGNDEGDSGLTHALMPGSPAIDAVPLASCTVSGDQRGFPRPYPAGGACDIGAYELGHLRLAKTATPASGAPYRGLVTYTLVLSNTGGADDPSVWLTDSLPAEVAFDSWIISPTNATLAGREIRWQGDLAAGQAVSLTFRVTNNAGYGSRVTNLAHFSGASDRGSGQGSFDVECVSSYLVQNANNSGAGSLRRGIATACPGGYILFSGDFTITLGSPLVIARPLTIDGGDHAITISGDGTVRVFNIAVGGIVTLNHLSLLGGDTALFGGGIYNKGILTVINSDVSYSWADTGGGGIHNGGTLTLQHSTLFGNGTVGRGGGLNNEGTLTVQNSTISGNLAYGDAGGGGGIANAGVLVVQNSTISGNEALDAGGGIQNFDGTVTVQDSTLSGNEALDAGGGIWSNGSLVVQSSTLSGNQAVDAGGGIYNEGDLTVQNSTLSNNSASTDGGGIYNAETLNYENTIVANSASGGDCYNDSEWGTIGVNNHNLVEDGSCGDGASGFLSGDPRLGPLADNGGPLTSLGRAPRTRALLPASPAIDAGDKATCLFADQRGEPRDDLHCDIGAFELKLADSDTVVKSAMAAGHTASFGPTLISVTITGGDAGVITATKYAAYPGGSFDAGEVPVVWRLSAASSPSTLTLGLCYTETDADAAGLDESSLRAFRWEDTGGGYTWTLQASTAYTLGNCVVVPDIVANEVGSLSAWTLYDTSVWQPTRPAYTSIANDNWSNMDTWFPPGVPDFIREAARRQGFRSELWVPMLFWSAVSWMP